VEIHGPPFEGTSVGDCVVASFREARVPPFHGDAVVLTKSFSIE